MIIQGEEQWVKETQDIYMNFVDPRFPKCFEPYPEENPVFFIFIFQLKLIQ